MGKKKRSGNQSTSKIILITALINLIASLINIINRLLE